MMMRRSLSTRAVHFAYLMGPPRFISRQEASELHGAVCEALGVDDLGMRFSPTEGAARADSRSFSVKFDRKEGRGEFSIVIDRKELRAPLRLLMQFTWPPSLEHVYEQFDMTARAVSEKLGEHSQKVLAEVCLRAQCNAGTGDALEFFRQKAFRLEKGWYDALGSPLRFSSMTFGVEATRPREEDPLTNPNRRLSLEVLKEDPSWLYLELVTNWPRLLGGPSADGGLTVDLSAPREILDKPSAYVKEAHEFLAGCVAALQTEG